MTGGREGRCFNRTVFAQGVIGIKSQGYQFQHTRNHALTTIQCFVCTSCCSFHSDYNTLHLTLLIYPSSSSSLENRKDIRKNNHQLHLPHQQFFPLLDKYAATQQGSCSRGSVGSLVTMNGCEIPQGCVKLGGNMPQRGVGQWSHE